MYKLKLTNNISREAINQILELDNSVFSEYDQMSREHAEVIYKNAPDCFVLVCDGDSIIGFVSAFAVKKSVFDTAVEINVPVYKSLSSSSFLGGRDKKAVYLYDFAISTEYQGKGLSNVLYYALYKWMEFKKDSCDFTDGVWADTVSDGGRRIAKKIGLKPVHRFNSMVEMQYADTEEVINCIKKNNDKNSWLYDIEVLTD